MPDVELLTERARDRLFVINRETTPTDLHGRIRSVNLWRLDGSLDDRLFDRMHGTIDVVMWEGIAARLGNELHRVASWLHPSLTEEEARILRFETIHLFHSRVHTDTSTRLWDKLRGKLQRHTGAEVKDTCLHKVYVVWGRVNFAVRRMKPRFRDADQNPFLSIQ